MPSSPPEPPEPPDASARAVNRRRILKLAGGTSLAAVVSACSSPAQPAAKPPSPSPSESPTGATAVTQPPQPIAPAPPPPIATPADLLCRDAWKARAPRPGGRPHTITRMTVHHTAVVLGDNSNSPGRLRQHQHYHMDTLGWIDIAYHIGVDRNGNIFELRTTELAGDTATTYDTTGHFLVVCEGNFDEEEVSEAQLDGAARAFAWAARTFGVTSQTLAGHRDVAPGTECPGTNLYAHLSSGDLKRRIDDYLVAGGVNLSTICGSEAGAAVAAIEAGR